MYRKESSCFETFSDNDKISIILKLGIMKSDVPYWVLYSYYLFNFIEIIFCNNYLQGACSILMFLDIINSILVSSIFFVSKPKYFNKIRLGVTGIRVVLKKHFLKIGYFLQMF